MSSPSYLSLLCGVSALSLVSVLAAGPALAQDATVLDVITVTGERIERTIAETASSVAVITDTDIEKEEAGHDAVSDVVKELPNVTYVDTVSAPTIRGQDSQGPHNGQASFWGGTVPRATINLDGHYLNYNEYYFGASSLWDVERIEVFRGPQTTSQGANAIAGATIVHTKDPTFETEGAYLAEIGNYNSKRAAFALSGPLIQNELAGRIALDYSGRDTFIDYISPSFVKGESDQDFRAVNARAKLLWQPSEIPGLEAKLTYAHTATNRPTQEAAAIPYEELTHTGMQMPSWNQRANTGILDVSYDFDNGFKLFNQLQYTDSIVHRVVNPLNGDADVAQTNLSNEARIVFGDETSPFSGVAGVFYADTRSDELLMLSGNRSTFDDTKRNLGIFAEASYRFAERWTLTGGLRYQRDHIERLGTARIPQVPPAVLVSAVDFDHTFDALLPKVSLAYEAAPGWTVGAMVSKGYNPGGVSLNVTANSWQVFKEETLWNYELFTRASLLDDRLNVNANLFYADFKNAQYNIPVEVAPGVFQSYTINAEDARSYGLEVSLDYRVLDNLVLKAGLGLLDTRLQKVSDNAAYDGNEFAKAPSYTLSFGATWDVTEKLSLSGQVRHTDGYFSDIANTPDYVIEPYTLADISASYQVHENMQVYGFVNNVFDERAPTHMKIFRGGSGTGVEASMTAPRMFGFGVRGTF